MMKLISLCFVFFSLLTSAWAEDEATVSGSLDPALLQRWQDVSAMSIGPRSQAFIDEGQQILARFYELESLEQQTQGDSLKQILRTDIAELKLIFQNLLRSIEQATLFDQSPEELQELRARYLVEHARLDQQRRALRDTTLLRGDAFLESYRRNPDLQRYSQREVVAKLSLRLGELHYDRSEEAYFDEMDSLLALVDLNLDSPTEPVRNQDEAVARYKRIIDEFPWSDYMDDALYAVAYIYENSRHSFEVQESQKLYEQLVRDFPQSPYAAESWMRLGEIWFHQHGEDALHEAVRCYGNVLAYETYGAREKALYKLGWCHYRLGNNAESVDFFAAAALHAQTLVSEGEGRADLLDESISYIAVNYADADWEASGVPALSGFLHEREAFSEALGFSLLNRLGDLHRAETQNFEEAVAAYDSLLAFYPEHEQAPWIQEKVIATYGEKALNQPEKAYAEKLELVERWGDSMLSDSDSALSGLLRLHLAETVNLAQTHAYASELKVDFEEFVKQSTLFLQRFPEDTLAFDFHWNLALTLEKKLEDLPRAYTQYMKMSSSYPVEKVRDASWNAIMIAQTLVDQKGLIVSADSTTALSAEEQLKLEALESFVTLYPQDPASPNFVLLAGKQAYNHQDFVSAVAYFDRLIEGWPQAEEFQEAYHLKLESLFARGLFAEAEAVALEIQVLNPHSDFAQQARVRQAESQYSYASDLKEGSKHVEAAQQFLRMARDVPDAPFADAALFDAANQFIEVDLFEEASAAYIELADTHAQSAFADRALSLAGFLFLEELNDYGRAAIVFDRLTSEYPDSEYFRTALGNAAFSYEKTEQWAHAIRLNHLYVDRFPQAEDAALVLFDNAGLYLKLNDETSANRIYADFAERFPQDPRAVQAFLERGEWLLAQSDQHAARDQFERAASRNQDLRIAGGSGNPLYASKALRHLIRWDHEALGLFEMSQLQRLDADLRLLQGARDRLLDRIDELISLQTGDVFYARFILADVHAVFARVFRGQVRATGVGEEAVRQEIEIQDASWELSLLAAQSYIATTKDLEIAQTSLETQREQIIRHGSKLNAWLTQMEADSMRAPEDSLVQSLALKEARDLVESSLVESAMWTARSRESVPGLLLDDLTLRESRIPMVLSLKSQHKSDFFLRMADRDRNILSGAALATVTQLVESYAKALELMAEVGLERLWRERVELGLQSVLAYLPRAYQEFQEEAWIGFDEGVVRFLESVEQGEDFIDRRGLAEEDYANDVLDLADFNQTYTLNAVMIHARLLEVLETQRFARTLAGPLSDSLALAALSTRASLLARAAAVDLQRDEYWRRFESTASYVFRDAYTTLEDAAYFLRLTAKDALLAAEPIVSATRPDSRNARRLFFALAKDDPARFGDRFSLQKHTTQSQTDSTWLVRSDYVESFVALGQNLSGWEQPLILGTNELGTQVWCHPDSTGAAPRQSFILKQFELTGTPLSASCRVLADDAMYIFFNGEYIDEVVPAVDSTGVIAALEVQEYDLSEFLRVGENVLAFEVEDRDASGTGLAAILSWVEMAALTEEVFEAQLQQELLRQQAKDFERRTIRLYDKNRVD
jgi:TolA-binding protein